ncbi:hypothetical protein [Stenotrophomonas mori]|uniref:Uncharacterized protein n=1 Tax=Stenotrophomonas mori TaxID=2871096 RepID=A0ABT0SJI1_9GAMM|nr:hypothetical protein [Stenotrophomonas mori]MCL7715479.1 hypothetical protein [Stenotrophomonas mori]
MNKTSLSSVLMIALAGTLAVAGCKKKDETAPEPMATSPAPMTEPAPPAPSAPALSVASITVGNAAAADKSVTPMAVLGAKDKIIVSVRTEGAAANAQLTARLTYQDGQLAGEQSAALSTRGGETTNVTFEKATGWPAGKYRAEVAVDGQPAGSAQEFEVK